VSSGLPSSTGIRRPLPISSNSPVSARTLVFSPSGTTAPIAPSQEVGKSRRLSCSARALASQWSVPSKCVV